MVDVTEGENTAEEAQVSKRKTKASLRREKEVEQLKMLLASSDGRAVLWRVLSQAGVYRVSFDGTVHTYFKEGKRAVGLWLLDEIFEADPAAFAIMQREATERGERK